MAVESTSTPTKLELDELISRIAEIDAAAAESREETEVAERRGRKAQVDLMSLQSMNATTQQRCRELQRSTKLLQEEADRLHADSLARRSSLTGKFDQTIDDITKKISEQALEVHKVVEENGRLAERLEKFEAQYAAARKHWETEAHAKQLEQRLAHARLAEAEGRFHQQRLELEQYRLQVGRMGEADETQRQQAAKYKQRLDELAETVAKNAAVFETYVARTEECDARTKKLMEEMEHTRAKVYAFDEKRSALQSRCHAVEAKLAEATARRDSLASDVRRLHAQRAERGAAEAKAGGSAAAGSGEAGSSSSPPAGRAEAAAD
ncbi:hypothetical protein AB1Y20_010311 [Prymnesium parvum]|uniref:Uncharacterized protein n=1 Tax=Prymnesium parvum TaxID=97485 RepID=A0AB34K404_PRYPA